MNLRKAVNAKCKDCIYDPLCGGGTWREQVAQCSSPSCPLWSVRPAPESGPFANPPRDPANVTREWLIAPVGQAKTSLLRTEQADPLLAQGVAAATQRRTPVPVPLMAIREADL